jgi:hypothetical protein
MVAGYVTGIRDVAPTSSALSISLRLKLHFAAALTLCAGLACSPPIQRGSLPAQLSAAEFWELSASLSEQPGVFAHSQNLVSNESQFSHLVQRLGPRGGVYIGVGPEQNFSYIARLQPAMAFIVDIRRENRNLHLLYKALFELSADRAVFLSRLFSRERAAGVGRQSAVDDLFRAYDASPASAALRAETGRQVRELLVAGRRFPLGAEDLAWIEHALDAFREDGPNIHYGRGLPATAAGPSYSSLMTATDLWRRPRSYLASEEVFAFVKALHGRNLIVPVIGDFAGPKAIAGIGEYVQRHGARVSAFYSSNVEVYLSRDQLRTFCGSVARLPRDDDAWFIGSRTLQPIGVKLRKCASVQPSLPWPIEDG